jgi:hypothetical protein
MYDPGKAAESKQKRLLVGRVAESTTLTTLAVAVHPNNTKREPACAAGVHPSHAHNY